MTNPWWEEHEAQVLEVFAPWGTCRHLKVWRNDGSDGIPWDTLQEIKTELVGSDVWMVEVFPPADQIMNDLNMRHLWEVPADHIFNMKLPERNRTDEKVYPIRNRKV